MHGDKLLANLSSLEVFSFVSHCSLVKVQRRVLVLSLVLTLDRCLDRAPSGELKLFELHSALVFVLSFVVARYFHHVLEF